MEEPEEHRSSPFCSEVEGETENGSKLYSTSIQENSLGAEAPQELVVGSHKNLIVQTVDAETKVHGAESPEASQRVQQGQQPASAHLKPQLLPTVDLATSSKSECIKEEHTKSLKDDDEEDIELATEDGHPPNLDGESGEKIQENNLSSADKVDPTPAQYYKKPRSSLERIHRCSMFSTNILSCRIPKNQLINSNNNIIESVARKIIPDVANVQVSILPSVYDARICKNLVQSFVKVTLIGRALQNFEEKLTSYKIYIQSNLRDVENHLKCSPEEAICNLSKMQQKCIAPLALEADLL